MIYLWRNLIEKTKMKKCILLFSAIFLLTGCTPQTAKNNNSRIVEVPPMPELALPVEDKAPRNDDPAAVPVPEYTQYFESLTSPLKAIAEAHMIVVDNPLEFYPQTTNIKIESLEVNRLKAIVTQDGLPDDVLEMQEYEMIIERQEDSSWKVIDKKLLREKCWPGRTDCN